MVDLFTRNYDVVVRFQGEGDAGHTVIDEQVVELTPDNFKISDRASLLLPWYTFMSMDKLPLLLFTISRRSL